MDQNNQKYQSKNLFAYQWSKTLICYWYLCLFWYIKMKTFIFICIFDYLGILGVAGGSCGWWLWEQMIAPVGHFLKYCWGLHEKILIHTARMGLRNQSKPATGMQTGIAWVLFPSDRVLPPHRSDHGQDHVMTIHKPMLILKMIYHVQD